MTNGELLLLCLRSGRQEPLRADVRGLPHRVCALLWRGAGAVRTTRGLPHHTITPTGGGGPISRVDNELIILEWLMPDSCSTHCAGHAGGPVPGQPAPCACRPCALCRHTHRVLQAPGACVGVAVHVSMSAWGGVHACEHSRMCAGPGYDVSLHGEARGLSASSGHQATK